MNDRKRPVVTLLLALWAMAFGYAFYHFATAVPTGDSFLRGMNRVLGYLGWQGVAGMIALAVFALGRDWPKGSPVRKITFVPLFLAILHVWAIIGVIAWARFG